MRVLLSRGVRRTAAGRKEEWGNEGNFRRRGSDDLVRRKRELMDQDWRWREVGERIDHGAAQRAIMRGRCALVDVRARRCDDQHKGQRGEQRNTPAPTAAQARDCRLVSALFFRHFKNLIRAPIAHIISAPEYSTLIFFCARQQISLLANLVVYVVHRHQSCRGGRDERNKTPKRTGNACFHIVMVPSRSTCHACLNKFRQLLKRHSPTQFVICRRHTGRKIVVGG
ncbi:MAG: hypothetical protein JWR56_2227 [Massilia sp.]|nr:hypothetical protein [Massilia sp.]